VTSETAVDSPRVIAVSRDDGHRFSKPVVDEIVLVEGVGVQGDAHAGSTVQHLFDKRRDPSAVNLRQVHLIQAELLDDVAAAGYEVGPGQLGENVTTRGIDLLALPEGARLHLGGTAVVRVTGLRNPCRQIDRFEPGLLREVVGRAEDGSIERRTGVMAVVETGGTVVPGDSIGVELPAGARTALTAV
jgi:MOSC domain-containing protein YiiM